MYRYEFYTKGENNATLRNTLNFFRFYTKVFIKNVYSV